MNTKLSRLLKVFWYRIPRPGNFGDILTPLILESYGYQVKHAVKDEADYIMVGSIARVASTRHTVLGSGVMTANPVLSPEAKWLWVRGPRTRHAVLANGGDCPQIYGDPALLLPRIVSPSKEKKHKIGIIPHYIDYVWTEKNYHDHNVIKIINADPKLVIEEITSCEKIISSSLHGIIAAHAYGIPAAWVKFSNQLAGDDTKFHDHYEAVGLTAQPSTVENPIFTTIDFNDSEIHQILEQGNF
jgi:pyruvyltransferase